MTAAITDAKTIRINHSILSYVDYSAIDNITRSLDIMGFHSHGDPSDLSP